MIQQSKLQTDVDCDGDKFLPMTNKNFARDCPYFWKRSLQLKADETRKGKEIKFNGCLVVTYINDVGASLVLMSWKMIVMNNCYQGRSQKGIEGVLDILKAEKKFCEGLPLYDERGRLNLGTSEVQNTSK